MTGYNIKIEFGKQAKKFRIYFGLGQKETAYLSDMSLSDYRSLENGKANYSIEKIQHVSSIYGLLYYKMANPSCKFPALRNLPKETQALVNISPEPLQIDKYRLIVEYLTDILSVMPKGTEFLIKSVNALIEEKFGVLYQDEQIFRAINKSFQHFIIKSENRAFTKEVTGVKPFYYQVLNLIPIEMVNKAKETISINRSLQATVGLKNAIR